MADISNSVLPLYKKINDAQSDLFPLSLTAEFKVSLNLGYNSDPTTPDSLPAWLTKCGIANSPFDLARYDFFASEVTLPGASFDMAESSGDRQGTLERFAQRRLYAPLTVTFYVDSDYNILRLFEEWMNFINPIHNSDGKYQGSFQGPSGYEQRNNYYKFRYPDDYKRSIIVTKFEKDFYQGLNMNETRIGGFAKSRSGDELIPGSLLMYQFIDAFPSNIVAIPLSYEGTQVTKVQIEFQYLRYNTITNNDKSDLYSENVFGQDIVKNYDNSILGQLNASAAKSSTIVGFVNGEPYSGPYHVHEKEDGTIIKMTGVVHSDVAHNIIYETAEESLSGAVNTTTVVSNDNNDNNDNNNQSNQQQQQQQADTTPPAAASNLSITTVASDNTPTITGQAESNSTVKVFNGSDQIGTAGVGSDGSFSVTISNALANGTYTFSVTVTDAAGNVSNTSNISHTINVPSDDDGGGNGYSSPGY
tara:strand:+ start:231 stop:1655 length:1425 start_codon:yes stop_codon:yes gene_type:complete